MEIELLEKPTTELTVTARAALALSSEQTRKDLKELVAKSANIKEVKNTAGREEAHSYAMALVKARTTITKTGKAAREDAAAFQKAVIAEEKALIAITEGEETRLLALRDGWDAAAQPRRPRQSASNAPASSRSTFALPTSAKPGTWRCSAARRPWCKG